MKHFVVTVGCEFGSGGPEIGKMLASAMGIEYYNRDLVDKIVEKTGVDRALSNQNDAQEFLPFGMHPSLGIRYANLSNTVIYTQFEVIQKMARHSCVIIGRCSDYMLRDEPNIMNVFIYAPEEARIQTVARAMHVTPERAAALIHDYDSMLHRRYKYITGTYRGDRHNRHLLVDSSVLGWERTARFIQEFVTMRFGES